MLLDEHVVELLPAYALECLDEGEELMVARHLSQCSACRSELEAYNQVVDVLPMAAALVEPPPQLKDRILQRAHAARSPQVPGPAGFWHRLFSRLGGFTPAWSAASLVLILVLGVSNLLLWQRASRPPAASQSGLMTLTLTGAGTASQAIGTLVISKDGDHGTLVVDGLAVLDQAYQYQIWLIRDGVRTSGGVFSVDEFGYGALWIDSPEPLENFDAFGVTVEPWGGSPGPTGEKVLGGSF